MQPASRIVGRIIGEKGAAPDFAGVRVGAKWIYNGIEINPLSVDESPVQPDGTFQLGGLFGTRQLQLIALDPIWEIRSITQGRIDLTQTGISLTPDGEANVVVVVGRR
jgi:hypothetical protein